MGKALLAVGFAESIDQVSLLDGKTLLMVDEAGGHGCLVGVDVEVNIYMYICQSGSTFINMVCKTIRKKYGM